MSILLGFSTFALAATRPLQGRGTSATPYRITSAADWAIFADDVAAGKSEGKYYTLTRNIETNVTVGTKEQPFKGIFDGKSKTITFTIDAKTAGLTQGTAPFRCISGATIRRLNANSTIEAYGGDAGGLVGYVMPAGGKSTIENCRVTGKLILNQF